MTFWLALAAGLAWLVLLLGRGFFWLARDDDRDAARLPDPPAWPSVAAIVPARDEAETIGATVASLLAQDYPGAFRLVVVDDRSSDGTGDLARAAAAGDPRLTVVTGGPRAPGWTGKLWALEQGLREAQAGAPDYLLLTDADIRHAPDSLRLLVRRAVAERRVLVSLMARLRCESAAERWLIPAFIFFFQMLYPFRWSNDPRARTAAAAGGCVLLDRAAFARAGGLAPIRGALIDDCALARQMKRVGPIWIGLTGRVDSLRLYETVGPIRRMVARTAYAQLGYSPLLLAGMILALGLVFLAPPLLALLVAGPAAWLGGLAWGGMAVAFAPTLRRFGLSPFRGLALPAIAAAYMAFTLDSALAEWRGRGGMWKGEAGPRAESGAGPRVN
ncbi:glycosyltransferase [Paracraurococcus lichenis]|uniref:Glycosyltransferase n=1 Tax=Paracraurococcus lichenis TaxID=3064888 RepID=A0ABT9E3Y3_9PROT|nr:glycosyltransferase [Paracraurococcus sp. LOR1-02]MDO9710795.1 glycosyltransferase [Paracraurococcus sp. LOR1-02]